MTKRSPEHVQKAAALETIEGFAGTQVKVFTDGSASSSEGIAGYGALILYPIGGPPKEELLGPCGTMASNYDAELEAIHRALESVHRTLQGSEIFGFDTVLFCDSRSALEVLASEKRSTHLVDAILEDVGRLERLGGKVTVQWIPSHVNVNGNEKADSLAKAGAALPQPEAPVTYLGAKTWLKDHFRSKWYQEWADNTTARGVFANMPRPSRSDQWWNLSRKHQSLVTQMRTEHCPTNSYFHRLDHNRDSNCRHCSQASETVVHLVTSCPALDMAGGEGGGRVPCKDNVVWQCSADGADCPGTSQGLKRLVSGLQNMCLV